MNNQALSISLSNRETITDPYWLNMEIVEDEHVDGMTIGAAAEIIDSLYDIEICGKDNPDLWNMGGTREPAEEKFNDVIGSIAPGLADCRNISSITDDPGSYDVQVKVYRSHEYEKYKFIVSNGTASGPQRIDSEQVTETVHVENATHVTMDKPVGGTINLAWIGASATPEIKILGNTFYWEGNVTGTLRAEFGTYHDLINVHVHGQAGESSVITGSMPPEMFGEGWYSGSENNAELENIQNIQCSVLAFYHYQYEELQLNRPEDDGSVSDDVRYGICATDVTPYEGEEIAGDEDGEKNCFQLTNQTNICICSGDTSQDRSRKAVACPAGVLAGTELAGEKETTNYTDCGEREEPYLPEVYEEKCCYPPADDLQALFYPQDERLPWCKTRTTAFAGGKEMDQATKDELKAQYQNISFIGVAPPSTGCGEWTLEQVIKQHSCCEEVSPIAWDEENSVEVIADGSSGTVFVTGGKAPYTWTVRGQGAYTNASYTEREAVTDSPSLDMFMENGCGLVNISVTDGCSVATGFVRSATGEWVKIRDSGYNVPYYVGSGGCDSGTVPCRYNDERSNTTTSGKYMSRVTSFIIGRHGSITGAFLRSECGTPAASCESYLTGDCDWVIDVPDDGVYGGEPTPPWRDCSEGVCRGSCFFDYYFPVARIETWEWIC